MHQYLELVVVIYVYDEIDSSLTMQTNKQAIGTSYVSIE